MLKRLSFSVLAVIFLPAIILLMLTAFISVNAGVPIATFVRDPAFTMEAHPLTGVISNLGVLVWCAAAATCFFGAALLRHGRSEERVRSFLLWSGAITSVLFLDDFFLIHDDLAYRYLRLNEKFIMLGYGLAVAIYLVHFRRVILGSDYVLLLLAMGMFGASFLVDQLQDRWLSPWRIFVEDGAKFLGIASWSGYLMRTSFQAVTSNRTANLVNVPAGGVE